MGPSSRDTGRVLTFPAWYSKVDRELIDSALRTVCPPVVFNLGETDQDTSPWVPEPVAVQNILTVAEVVASRLPDPFPEERWRDLEGLLAQIIVLVAKRRTSPKSPLETFEATVQDALSACAWWPTQGPSPSPDSNAPTAPGAQPPLSLPGAATLLGVSVDTLTRMVDRNEIQTVTVGTRRKVPVAEIERVLASPGFRLRLDR